MGIEKIVLMKFKSEDKNTWASSFFATTRSPLVSLSILCTIPGRITPFMPDNVSLQ